MFQDKVEHVMQFVMDVWGKQAEYIRHGLDRNYMMDNAQNLIPGTA